MATTLDHEFFSASQRSSLRSAEVIVPMIVELLKPQSVIDVGCGTGAWLATLGRAGVQDFVGVDRGEVPDDLLLIPHDRFIAHDLRTSLRCQRRFDLALALEVAEHLPGECAEQFVANLTSLAPQVLFSAAIPFQGGQSHVNEQWQSEWAQKFAQRNYRAIDCIRDRVWTNPNVEWWYAQNMVLFVADDVLPDNPSLNAMMAEPERLSRVHPLNYLTKADPQYMSLRWTLKHARELVRVRFRQKLGRGRPAEDAAEAFRCELSGVMGRRVP